MVANMKELWNQIRTQLAADKRKSAVMGVLLLVLTVLIGRTFVGKPAPDTADAAALVVPQTAAVGGSAETALTRPSPAIIDAPAQQPRAGTDAPESPVEVGVEADAQELMRRKRVSIDGLPRTPARDLFTTPAWSRFAPAIIADAPLTAARRKSSDPAGFWAALSRRLAEEQKQRMAEILAIEVELGELELQSTLTGPDAMAHISGQLVRPGQRIRGFSVVRIENRRVTLVKSGVTRSLSMP